MPTQEQINAAQVELDIANDNYARMADRYNRYNRIFEYYKDASPETQKKAEWLMEQALADYNQLKLDMLAAEDRIAVAQNAVNSINETIAAQQAALAAQQTAQWGQRRRVVRPTNTDTVTNQPTIVNNPFARYQQVPSINSQFVPNPDLLRMNWINVQTPTTYNVSPVTNNYWAGNVAGMSAPENVSLQIVNKTPTLSQWYIIPQHIQEVRNAYGSDYLRGIRNLEKMWYTVFNQKAYDKYGNVYNLYH